MAHSFTEVDGKPHPVTPAVMSLGLAVDVEHGPRSLVVPVIRDAAARVLALPWPPTTMRLPERADNTRADAYQGAQITPTNRRRKDNGGIGAPTDALPRSSPLSCPGGLAQADPDGLEELGVAKVMTMASTTTIA